MKLRFDEYDAGNSITLTPEDMAELTKLLRLSANAAAQPATVHFYFSGDSPYAVVYLKKISKGKQRSTIYAKRFKS